MAVPAGAYDPVLFDLDGTLVDTVELITLSFRHATRTVLGEVLPDEVITAGVGQPLLTQMRRLSPAHANELLDAYREYNHRRHDELIRRYEGIEEALAELCAAGLRMGIVTSKGAEATAMALAVIDLRRYVDVVITASDCDEHKPSPVPLLLGLERLGAAADGALYVGDSPYDIEAGTAAGMATLAVTWGLFRRPALQATRPLHWAETPAELVDVCLRRGRRR